MLSALSVVTSTYIVPLNIFAITLDILTTSSFLLSIITLFVSLLKSTLKSKAVPSSRSLKKLLPPILYAVKDFSSLFIESFCELGTAVFDLSAPTTSSPPT